MDATRPAVPRMLRVVNTRNSSTPAAFTMYLIHPQEHSAAGSHIYVAVI
jgi:hypothetical protein